MRLLLLLACAVSDAARLLAPIAEATEAVVLPDRQAIVQPLLDEVPRALSSDKRDKFTSLIGHLGTTSERLREELTRLWTCDPDSAVQRSVWWTAARTGGGKPEAKMACPATIATEMPGACGATWGPVRSASFDCSNMAVRAACAPAFLKRRTGCA